VIWFERQVYVQTVLGAAGGPDLDAYLARRLSVTAAPGSHGAPA